MRNTIKGLAPGIKSSTYPGTFKTHKEWLDNCNSERFNDTMRRIRFLTLNNKEDDKRRDYRDAQKRNY